MKQFDLVRFNHDGDGGPVHRVVSVMRDGKLELHDMSGYFAPCMFTLADDVAGIPEKPTTTDTTDTGSEAVESDAVRKMAQSVDPLILAFVDEHRALAAERDEMRRESNHHARTCAKAVEQLIEAERRRDAAIACAEAAEAERDALVRVADGARTCRQHGLHRIMEDNRLAIGHLWDALAALDALSPGLGQSEGGG